MQTYPIDRRHPPQARPDSGARTALFAFAHTRPRTGRPQRALAGNKVRTWGACSASRRNVATRASA